MKTTLLKNVLLDGKPVDILIEGNKFSKIAPEITDKADEVLEAKGKAILPAFYNCHTHISMTLLKGITDEKELHEWLEQDIWPREMKMSKDDIYKASKFAILEMIKGGTVFCNDMYMHPEETMRALDEMGIRGFVSKPEINKWNTVEESEQKKQKIIEFINYPNPNESRIIKGISCHSVYTLTEKFLQFYSDMAKKHNMYLHIHACETKKEVDDCWEKNDCSPIEHLEKFGLLTEKTILAHCVHVTNDDIKKIKKYKCKIAHCPVSNFKLKSGMMPFQKLLDKGVHITLGTDGSASNNSLSMLEEMKVCALNAKTQSGRSNAGKVDDIFKIATLNGAQAFNIDAGIIEKDKIADFILVDMNHYLLLPNHNLKSNLVYSAQNDCITDVFCDGKQIMKDRKVKDEEKIIEDFIKVSERFKTCDKIIY